MRLLTRRKGLGWGDVTRSRGAFIESFEMGQVISVSVLNAPNPACLEGV